MESLLLEGGHATLLSSAWWLVVTMQEKTQMADHSVSRNWVVLYLCVIYKEDASWGDHLLISCTMAQDIVTLKEKNMGCYKK